MNENDGFARIALSEGFCTRAQIDRCLQIQSETQEHLSLGQSLLREGFLTQDQYSRILLLLRQGAKKDRDTAVLRDAERSRTEDRASARRGQEDRVLGGILVAEGLITDGQLKNCLEQAALRGRSLADTLVTLRILEAARIEAILSRLQRTEVSCPSCKATISILRLPTSASATCPRCRAPL